MTNDLNVEDNNYSAAAYSSIVFSSPAHMTREADYDGPARSFAELCGAFKMVHDNYTELGYMARATSGMRYSVFELLPSATTFISMQDNRIVGTVSGVPDSLAGLPLCCAFQDEVEKLRAYGKNLAECTMFACDTNSSIMSVTYLKMMQWILSWACLHDIHNLCIVVHPKHKNFWEKIAGFTVLAEPRCCQHVMDNPGVLLTLDVEALLRGTQKPTRLMSKLKSFQINPTALIEDYRPDEEDIIKLLAAEPRLLKTINKYHLAILTRFYPFAVQQLLKKDVVWVVGG